MITRRDFLKSVGSATLVAGMGELAYASGVLNSHNKKSGLTDDEMLAVIRDGLPKSHQSKKIIIVGAGMAGLVAAYELQRAGHKPIILEAQERVGGRVRTLRDVFSHGLYAEAGAMRIPKAHALTLTYLQSAADRGAEKIETSPFTMTNPNTYCFIRNKKHTWREVAHNPACLGFNLEDRRSVGGFDERGKTPAQLWDETVAPLRDLLHNEGPDAWERIAAENDQYSTREFLTKYKWSEEAIQMFGLVENQQARLNNSVLALLREKLTGSFQDLVEVRGGMDLLPRSFLPKLQNHIYFGAKVEGLSQSHNHVTLHYRDSVGDTKSIEGDFAIITMPFPVLRHVDGIESFSNGKQNAIQGLNYDASGKILLQCRKRFWEDENIFGGGTESDLAIRSTWYPDHGHETGRGILLASYTWGRDALDWGNLSSEERTHGALKDVQKLHPQIAKGEDIIEGGTSIMWQNEPWAGGAFALFNPTQETRLYEQITKPEGRFYFAGEHASLNHRWIQGAIESALRVASEINLVSRSA